MVTTIKRSHESEPVRVKLVFHHVPQYFDFDEVEEDGEPAKVVSQLNGTNCWVRGHTRCDLVVLPPKRAQGDGSAGKDEEEVIASGIAYCSILDAYVRETGRQRSLAVMLKHCDLPGEAKHAIWNAYEYRPGWENRRLRAGKLKIHTFGSVRKGDEK